MSKLLSHEMSVDQLRKKIEEARKGRPDDAEIEEAEALLHVKMLEQTNQRLDEVSVTLEMYGAKLNRLTQSLRANVSTSEHLAKSQRRYSRLMLVLTVAILFAVFTAFGTETFTGGDGSEQIANATSPSTVQVPKAPISATPINNAASTTPIATTATPEPAVSQNQWAEAFGALSQGFNERFAAVSEQVSTFTYGLVQQAADWIAPEPVETSPVSQSTTNAIVIQSPADVAAPAEPAALEGEAVETTQPAVMNQAETETAGESSVSNLQQQFSNSANAETSVAAVTEGFESETVSEVVAEPLMTPEEAAAAFDAAMNERTAGSAETELPARQTVASLDDLRAQVAATSAADSLPIDRANEAFSSMENALSEAANVTVGPKNIQWDIPAQMRAPAVKESKQPQAESEGQLPAVMVLTADEPVVPIRQ